MSRVRIDGRPVFVTGASKGIGRAIALDLARRGCPLMLVARGEGALRDVQSEIRARHPGLPVDIHTADVTDASAMVGAVAAMVESVGRPAGVICAAGFARPGYFEEIPDDTVRQLVEVNYLGAVFAVRAVLPHLESGGFVSLTSSVLGYLGAFGMAPYAATKFALVGLATSLRQELRPRGIHVSVLCPPDTDTPGFAAENETKPIETAELSKSAGLLSPDFVARRHIDALRRGRFLINVTFATRAYYRINGWAPGLMRAAMDFLVARTQARMRRGAVGAPSASHPRAPDATSPMSPETP